MVIAYSFPFSFLGYTYGLPTVDCSCLEGGGGAARAAGHSWPTPSRG